MNIGIIIETNEPEKAWNGVRFANTALKKGHAVKIFLMSAGVEIESITDKRYNVKGQIDEFQRNRGTVLACGTCITSRGQVETEICPISTMTDRLEMVEWSDRVVTFQRKIVRLPNQLHRLSQAEDVSSPLDLGSRPGPG